MPNTNPCLSEEARICEPSLVIGKTRSPTWNHVNISQICAWPLIHFCQHCDVNRVILIHFWILSANRAHAQVQCFHRRLNERQGQCLWYKIQKSIPNAGSKETITWDELLWGIYFFSFIRCVYGSVMLPAVTQQGKISQSLYRHVQKSNFWVISTFYNICILQPWFCVARVRCA